MKTKKEVYVVVDTPKKAKKLKKVLDMFGEKRIINNDDTYVDLGNSKNWISSNIKHIHLQTKIQVSIKELKNILANEHLKEGDYIIATIGKTEYVVEFDRFKNNNVFGKRYITIHKDGTKGDLMTNGAFVYFKRYATPEEIALLEPKPKELVVGKWYKKVNKQGEVFIFNHQKNGNSYGWFKGEWTNIAWHTDSFVDYVLLLPQEVESYLIAEAKRRGFKEGVFIKSIWLGNCKSYQRIGSDFHLKNNELLVDSKFGLYTVFKGGKWATPIVEKFAELKEAHKNGAIIECLQTYGEWLEAENPKWQTECEYRIKPEEKPKVGDVVKVDYGDDFAIKILRPSDLSSQLYKYTKLTKQQLLDLFPNL